MAKSAEKYEGMTREQLVELLEKRNASESKVNKASEFRKKTGVSLVNLSEEVLSQVIKWTEKGPLCKGIALTEEGERVVAWLPFPFSWSVSYRKDAEIEQYELARSIASNDPTRLVMMKYKNTNDDVFAYVTIGASGKYKGVRTFNYLSPYATKRVFEELKKLPQEERFIV